MEVMERIRSVVESNAIVLFMRGVPARPMCAASADVVDALNRAEVRFAHVDVQKDPEIRANLPRYSHQPGFPQLFLNGELIGGIEVVMELDACGELERMVKEMSE
jgi:monothiol glutaredoxin